MGLTMGQWVKGGGPAATCNTAIRHPAPTTLPYLRTPTYLSGCLPAAPPHPHHHAALPRPHITAPRHTATLHYNSIHCLFVPGVPTPLHYHYYVPLPLPILLLSFFLLGLCCHTLFLPTLRHFCDAFPRPSAPYLCPCVTSVYFPRIAALPAACYPAAPLAWQRALGMHLAS